MKGMQHLGMSVGGWSTKIEKKMHEEKKKVF